MVALIQQRDYTETKIATKFGEFNIRVYRDKPNKETVVLWTDELNTNLPVLVRVHSECMTGELVGSLQCDCGQQLLKSLQLIKKEAGVLIYLRQEGRGIGLFEKIKAYHLQSKGYDTFEANTLLGHRPDARTYEMVKVALEDLNVQCIRLLTNNPSKVSEVAKLGIQVIERVPLIVKPNKYNKFYFETKERKFKHSFKAEFSNYFYQVHVENPVQVEQIGKFLKNKNLDPLLKICIGVAANHKTLSSKKEKERIRSIFEICAHYEELVPVLHFSFRDSIDVLKEMERIRTHFLFVNRLQVNDLSRLKVIYLKKAYDLFQKVDVPLSEETFGLIHNKQFRNLIKKHKSFILLDNSKGKGIQESKDSFMKKMEILLSYGFNDISLCGGFGPDELDTYFELRRYYRVNFSIDAETKLKKKGKIDIEKIKLYLSQLIRFDDPNLSGIEQTRKFLEQHRRSTWESIKIEDREFLIHPKVFHPGYFPSTRWFASEICNHIKGHVDFCEVGCGSGVISCLVALANPRLHIIATDINPYATQNTELNAERLGLKGRVEALQGDVLDNIPEEYRFDSIFWALPFGFLDPGTNIDLEEIQVFDPGYRAIRKFFQTAKKYLKPDGKLLIGFSSCLGHQKLLEQLAKESNINLSKVSEKEMRESEEVTFELLVGKYLKN